MGKRERVTVGERETLSGFVYLKSNEPDDAISSRFYDFLAEDNLPEIAQSCERLLKSEAMFLILSNLTGLRLHRLAPKPSLDSASSTSSLVDLEDVTFENPEENQVGDGEKSSGGDSEGSATSEPTRRRKRRRIGSSGEAAGCSSADAAAVEMKEDAAQDAEGSMLFCF